MKKKVNYALAFTIPVLLMIIIYACVGIYPFGDKSLLTVDLQDQYIEFFNSFRNILQGNSNIFYSFSKTLGGNMFGLFTYYLSSPFNLLVVFFKTSDMTDAILLINLLKIGFCGLTSFIYFNNTFKRNDKMTIMFSIIYSLMSYNIVYSQNIMWLDGVIWLPIIFLGIDKLLDKKPILFYISLSVSILSNYYIGYMSCIASLIYFIYKLYLKNNGFSLIKNKSEILYFIKYALLSVGTVAIFLLPTVFSLLAGKAEDGLSQALFKQTYPLVDLLSKFYLGTFKDSIGDTTPNIYISVIVISLVFLFFFNPKINYKEKKISLIVILVFLVSFLFYPIDLIWHMFQHPVGFVFRYSFIFDFFILIIAYNSFINLKKVQKNLLIKFLISTFIITIFIDKFLYNSASCYRIILTYVFLFIYALYFYYRKNKNISNIIILIVITEMVFNGVLTLKNFKYEKKDNYVDFVNNYGSIIDSVKKDDQSFYRLENETSYSTNDPMLLNYNGISHFSSTYESNNNKLLGDYLGIFNRFYITNYLGSTPITNSLFNIKYVLSERNLPYYELIKTENNINLYKNDYYLPFMFMVDSDMLNINLNKLEPFNNQNLILNTMTNTSENVFKNNSFNITLNNVEQNEKITKYKEYKKINSNKDASILFDIIIEHDGILYANISSDYNKWVDILLDGKSIIDITDENNYRYNTLELGDYKKGDIVELEIILLEDTLKITDYNFCILDKEEFEKKIDLLNNNDSLKIEEYKGNYIKGTINVTKNDQILYTSIPIDKGWHVYIDGNEVEYDELINTFIGVTLDVGQHTIEFEYIPRGFSAGLIISIFSVCMFGYSLYIDSKNNKKQKRKS